MPSLLALHAVDEVERDLGLGRAVVEQRVGRNADLRADLGDRLHLGFACDLDVGLHDRASLPPRRVRTRSNVSVSQSACNRRSGRELWTVGWSNVSPALMPVDAAYSAAATFAPVAGAYALGQDRAAGGGDRHSIVGDARISPGLAAAARLGAVVDVELPALDRGPGAGRRVGGADQVVDVGCRLRPVDLGQLLLEPATRRWPSEWSCGIFGALPARTRSRLSIMASTPIGNSFLK